LCPQIVKFPSSISFFVRHAEHLGRVVRLGPDVRQRLQDAGLNQTLNIRVGCRVGDFQPLRQIGNPHKWRVKDVHITAILKLSRENFNVKETLKAILHSQPAQQSQHLSEKQVASQEGD
jgi:hypothetical protein